MELGEFVENSLVEVVNAVKRAKEKTGQKDGYSLVSPNLKVWNLKGALQSTAVRDDDLPDTCPPIQLVQFDIAVAVTNKKQGKASGKIEIFTANIGTDGAVSKEESEASRMKFSVPVIMP